ncbi:hypothetical protein SODALDRAFT_327718 [Sodiomyces alkalinus F11]|uniref:Uncharacterized protein n=1 Tax=Sodiomyces alkalinus (strain CBS 110278 / VKM F-3762 / F11) TaxID=1314773 RepID=A0A3N2Q9S0_SODAK|nr:hypothetical protein SODALDRAFT_327718 [Sodiomyces alkalinus F11]ROT43513.1 hypothetical protein SODALDRAFT_327718 [Sodiomyces alkalinus F11]
MAGSDRFASWPVLSDRKAPSPSEVPPRPVGSPLQVAASAQIVTAGSFHAPASFPTLCLGIKVILGARSASKKRYEALTDS